MVFYDLLLHKIESRGLDPTLIRRMYADTCIRVRFEFDLSDPFQYERGVRQSCSLSLLLFNIFINDLFDDIPFVPVNSFYYGLSGLMYADDTVIVADSAPFLVNCLSAISARMLSNGMGSTPENAELCILLLIPFL
ncbi:hypothetical protein PAEPH01_1817 [Pancytospora epiphaga]|nr:hypothetical protein PAEPH01_1817 [Pancytospora epiphaga]